MPTNEPITTFSSRLSGPNFASAFRASAGAWGRGSVAAGASTTTAGCGGAGWWLQRITTAKPHAATANALQSMSDRRSVLAGGGGVGA